ncbi:DUF6191 domain-containing protein [Streptomyces sp. NPDC012888]|uniref:DUF6191 domain-containing protein n=1 Tax=Streptomyces sp. NPDC012888 TaxID=3364855 RepID=UPI0036A20ED1
MPRVAGGARSGGEGRGHRPSRERQSALVMRDDEQDGAPPRTRVDLGAGTVVVRL